MTVRVVAVLIVATAALAASQQPRDAQRAPGGTASIAGTVLVDGDPKRPARMTRVTLTDGAGAVPGQTTTTDDRGAFSFRGLPAGRFELRAFKNAYLRASYGASRPERAGTPVVVKDGEAVAGLSIPIVRGGVITGVVRDMRGRPVSGANVRVLRIGYTGVTGERTLSSPNSASTTTTDDRGEYRAYGLPPGGYVVLVPPSNTGRGNEGIRQLSSDEIRQALQASRAGAQVASSAGAPVVSAASARVNLAPVFHPGTTDITTAATIPLGLGEERAGVDVTMQLVPTATVTVTVTSSSGTLPPMLAVRLTPLGPYPEMLAGAGLRGPSPQQSGGGRYVFSGVPPGAYLAKAFIGRGRGAPADVPTQWAAADIHVAGEDVELPLLLQPGVAVNGRVVFEGAQPTPAELESLTLMLVAPGAGGEIQSSGGGRVDKDGRFSFAGVTPDTYRFATTWSAPAARGRWSIKSSAANGHEAFENPLRVNPNEPVEWIVTFTDNPATLTGLFEDTAGRAAPDYYILVFSTDRGHWVPGSRRIQMTRPATDGRFTVKGLPAGTYFLAALPDLESGEWNDPALLEQLAKAAAQITLRDGETTRQNYRLGRE